MKRREAVRAAVAVGATVSFSGCIDELAADGDDGLEAAEFEIDPHDVDADEWPIEYAARLAENGYADPETPLTVEVEITNRLDGPLGFGEQRRAQFHQVSSTDERFTLFPADIVDAMEEVGQGEHDNQDEIPADVVDAMEGIDPYEYRDDCWVLTAPLGMLGDYRTAELDAGESVSTSLYLLPRADGCPEPTPEEIPFSTEITVWQPEPTPADREEEVYEWGFALARI